MVGDNIRRAGGGCPETGGQYRTVQFSRLTVSRLLNPDWSIQISSAPAICKYSFHYAGASFSFSGKVIGFHYLTKIRDSQKVLLTFVAVFTVLSGIFTSAFISTKCFCAFLSGFTTDTRFRAFLHICVLSKKNKISDQ